MSIMTAVQKKEMTLGLMGQPNTGKSTMFNALTGSRQYVGNRLGKTRGARTVFSTGGRCTLADLPGTYNLSADSEEITTRRYVVDDNADMVFALADASQWERSMFLLSGFAGVNRLVVVLLDMADVAKAHEKTIDADKLSKALSIPVLPIAAPCKGGLNPLYAFLDSGSLEGGRLNTDSLAEKYRQGFGLVFSELTGLLSEYEDDACGMIWLTVKLLEDDHVVMGQIEWIVDTETWRQIGQLSDEQQDGVLTSSDCKFQWIQELMEETVSQQSTARPIRSRFDRLATSKRW